MYYKYELETLYEAFPELLDGLKPPDSVDRGVLIDTIMDNFGEFSIARRIPKFQKAVELWSRRNQYFMRGTMATVELQYNPIDNYDRQEEYSDSRLSSGTNDTVATSNGEGTTDSATKESSYESGNLTPTAEVNTTTAQKNTTNTGVTATGSETFSHKAHLHGNIGVTTTQQMIEEERRIVDFDPYLRIAEKFAMDLLIGIY